MSPSDPETIPPKHNFTPKINMIIPIPEDLHEEGVYVDLHNNYGIIDSIDENGNATVTGANRVQKFSSDLIQKLYNRFGEGQCVWQGPDILWKTVHRSDLYISEQNGLKFTGWTNMEQKCSFELDPNQYKKGTVVQYLGQEFDDNYLTIINNVLGWSTKTHFSLTPI